MYNHLISKARALAAASFAGALLAGCVAEPVEPGSSSASEVQSVSSVAVSSSSSIVVVASSSSEPPMTSVAEVYKEQCSACHDDGEDSIGTKAQFGAKDDIDIINSNGRFVCDYVSDCSSHDILSDYIAAEMPLGSTGKCDGQCADDIATYIIEELQNSQPVAGPGDEDKDGVKNTDDQCPSTPGPTRNNGCPVPANQPDPAQGNQLTGLNIYEAQCLNCHGGNGGGTNIGPSLIQGECATCSDFGDLVDKIEMSMPFPGACVGNCAIDVSTYIVSAFTSPIQATNCAAEGPSSSYFPIRRLNKREYTNTVVDLFGVDPSLVSVIPEEQNSGFDNDAVVLGVNSSLVDSFISASEAVASAFANSLTSTSIVPDGDQCDTTAQCRTTFGAAATDCANSQRDDSHCQCGNERCDAGDAPQVENSLLSCTTLNDNCAYDFIKNTGQKIYRRPLTGAEETSLRALYNEGKTIDFAAGIQLVVEGMLQSPAFIYRAEFGAGTAQNGMLRLTSWEIATRLSYMFWASAPDDTLLQLAAEDKLRDKAIIAQQAERLLGDNRAKAVMRLFFRGLLQESKILSAPADSAVYPHMTEEAPQLYLKELDAFVDHVLWQSDASWEEFLAADYTFVNNALAQVYAYNSPGSNNFVKVSEPGRNFGLFSLGAVMASRAHETETAPVLRGALILQNFMCMNIELPEDDSGIVIEPPVPDSNATTRERWHLATQGPDCEGCHRLLNPAGFAFENFDPAGRWRETDQNLPVDTEIFLPGTDISGNYSGPGDLVNAFVQSDQAAECAVNQWAYFSYGHQLESEAGQVDECSVRSAYDAFVANNKSVKELLIALTQTNAFLYKSEVN